MWPYPLERVKMCLTCTFLIHNHVRSMIGIAIGMMAAVLLRDLNDKVLEAAVVGATVVTLNVVPARRGGGSCIPRVDLKLPFQSCMSGGL